MADETATRVLLVETVKNAGPNILEWVAHHLLCGFDLQIYQNDSDDETAKHLRTLQSIGAIEYFRNHSDKRDWQTKAYRRCSFSEAYHASDWCMALDGDEFLNVRVGQGRVQDLIEACPETDEILVNWRIFGSGHETDLNDRLVTERYRLAAARDVAQDSYCGFKSLFRTSCFKRPGIHRARAPLVEAPRMVNGSGLREGQFAKLQWRSRDPENMKYAQVNHYAVRDAASFLLKSVRGSSSHPDREVARDYWRRFNLNIEEDDSLASRSPQVYEKMCELNDRSRGRLFFLREQSLRIWREKLDALMKNPAYADMFAELTAFGSTGKDAA